MFIDYFTHNFITLTLLAFLVLALIINRRLAVPATGYFIAGIVTILLTTAVDSANVWLQNGIMKDMISQQSKALFLFQMSTLGVPIAEFIIGLSAPADISAVQFLKKKYSPVNGAVLKGL